MQDCPNASDLLRAVEQFLEEEVVPSTEKRRSFLARVAINTLRIVRRELELEEAQLAGEWERLADLLGEENLPDGRSERREAIARRTKTLSEKIRAGEADSGEWARKVVAHLRRTVRDKLSVSDPRWLSEDER